MPGEEPSVLASGCVLLIEDDARIAAFMLKALRAVGYEANWTSSGRAGLEAMASLVPGVVLLDLGLPDIDGLDVLREMRVAGRTMPVIIVTARSDAADRVTATGLGVDAFLNKPFPLKDLLAAVDAAFASAAISDGPPVIQPGID